MHPETSRPRIDKEPLKEGGTPCFAKAVLPEALEPCIVG